MNYCSHCGSERLTLSIPSGDDRMRYVCPDCHRIHYQNPNMVVGVLPVYEGKILLCRRAIEPRHGFWNLPAGFLENGETVAEGALRETWEEARARVEILRLHAIYDLPHVQQVYLFFLANLSAPEFDVGPESLEVQLFAPEDIPFEEIAFHSTTFAIRKYLENPEYHGVHMGRWEKRVEE